MRLLSAYNASFERVQFSGEATPMLLKTFENRLVDNVLEGLWRQWSAIGVAGHGSIPEGLVVDPEALLAATLTIGRRDPRLFDEVLDWLTVNGDLLNVGRLHTMMHSHGFRGGRALAGVARVLAKDKGLRYRWKPERGQDSGPQFSSAEVLFHDRSGNPLPRPRDPDPDFLEVGLQRERVVHRGLSRPFPLRGAASLLLRLRALIGLNSRCELICLLASRPAVSGSEAAFLASYSPRTIQRALSDMGRSGALRTQPVGKQVRYSLVPGALSGLLPEADICFPPAPVLLATLEIIAAAARQCIEMNASLSATAALIRREIEPLHPVLARAGLTHVLAATANAPANSFLPALQGDTAELLRSWYAETKGVTTPGNKATA